MNLDEARRLALALPEAAEADHHGRPSFRVRGKIFATVPDPEHLNIMIDGDATQFAVQAAPQAFAELWWGKKLSGVTVTLAAADAGLVADLLESAWRQRAPKSLVDAEADELATRPPPKPKAARKPRVSGASRRSRS